MQTVNAAFQRLSQNPDDAAARQNFAKAVHDKHTADMAAGKSKAAAYGGTYPGVTGKRLYSRTVLRDALAFGIIRYGLANIDWSRLTHDIVHLNGLMLGWMGPCTAGVVHIGTPCKPEQWRKPLRVGTELRRRDRPNFAVPLRPAHLRRHKGGVPQDIFDKKTSRKVGRISFDRNGSPIFQCVAEILMPPSQFYHDRPDHFLFCNIALRDELQKQGANTLSPQLQAVLTWLNTASIAMMKSGAPPLLTWHHHLDAGRMQLVERDLHAHVQHDGGQKLWGMDVYQQEKVRTDANGNKKEYKDRHRMFKIIKKRRAGRAKVTPPPMPPAVAVPAGPAQSTTSP